jgi:sugar phosphate permease
MSFFNRPDAVSSSSGRSEAAAPGKGIKQGLRFPHIFPGWWTVLAGGLLALWGYGYNAYGISALFKPISQEFGFKRAATSVASSIGRFEGGIEGPITGWVTDRFGARYVILLGVFFMSLALLLMRLVNSLWSFYLIWGVMLGTGSNIALSLPIDTTISNWFVKKRGVALSIKWVFSGLSGVLVMPLIAWMLTVKDWRFACTVGGVVMGVVGMPIAWFLFKPHRPEYYGLLPDGAIASDLQGANQNNVIERGVQYASEVREVEFTLRQALRTPPFWVMVAVQAVNGLVGPVMSIHCIPFLTDMGVDPIKAAGMMSIWITASLPTRFIGGWAADRLKINQLRYLTSLAYFLQAVGVVIFLKYQSISIVYVWFILYGFGQGLVTSVNPLIRGRYFGRKAYGSISGISSLIMTPIGVAAPIYAGWIYDTTGSYVHAFGQFSVLLGVSTVLALFVLPPKPPAQMGDVRKIV